MITYCRDCGKKMEHKVLEKPNFCIKCGVSLGKDGGAPRSEAPVRASAGPYSRPAEEEPENVDGQPLDFISINGLDFDIEYEVNTNGERIENVVDGSQPQNRSKSKEMGKREYNKLKKQALSDLQNEGGTSREN